MQESLPDTVFDLLMQMCLLRLILKGKLLWSIDQVDEGNEMFWQAHSLDPNHHEVIEFLSIQKPRAEEFYKKATRAIFEGNRYLALELI